MAEQKNFYEQITPIHSISEIADLSNYTDIPDDWLIALTDVRNSTVAIQRGRYKDVNAIAGASIAALLNIIPHDIPFVFGGDGATVLVPPDMGEAVRGALIATQRLAEEQFGLSLRVGIIPVQDVLKAGYQMRVTRLKMSENFEQAIFTGGGLAYAEFLLKDPTRSERYAFETDEVFEADYTGFECRWNAIPSPYEETISLIVYVIEPDNARRVLRYQDIIHWIDEKYGTSQQRHPIDTKRMSLIFNPLHFSVETRIRDRTRSLRRLLRMAWITMKGRIALWFNIGRWGEYKDILAAATDNEKFDDTLRMIISGTRQQGQDLRDYLETLHAQGILAYGVESSSHCLMTCIVFDHFGRQVHFVDGANGGYALAALQMKEQLKALGQLG